MAESVQKPSPKFRLDFTDACVVWLRNWRLLVTVPLLAGAVAYALGYVLPKAYLSGAIIALPNPTPDKPPKQTPQQVAGMMNSPLVLDAVIRERRFRPDLNLDQARGELARLVKAVVGKDQLVRLEVEGPTAAESQATAQSVLRNWLRSTVPSDREKADLKRKLEVASAGFDSTQKALNQLVVENPLAAGRRDGGISVVAIGQLGDHYLDQVLVIGREMEGIQPEVIRQAPTLPSQSIKPRKLVLAVTTAASTFIVLLVMLLLRHLFDLARADPRTARTLNRFRAAFRGERNTAVDQPNV
jgi:hypothetical protein